MYRLFESIINIDRMEHAVSLFGSFDENINIIEKEFNVTVVSRGSELRIQGDEEAVSLARRAVNGLLALVNKGESLNEQNVRYVISMVHEGNDDKLISMSS